MPKVYMIETSPAVRGVLLTAKALNLDIERVVLDAQNKKEHLKPEYLKINPQHTVPTLVDNDGTIAWDSHVIMSYLVDKYGKTDDLYPKDLKRRAIINQRMYFEGERLYGNIRNVIGPILQKKTDKISEAVIENINNVYGFLNTFIGDNNYVAGNTLTIADLSLITTSQMLHNMIPVDKKYTNIHRWFKTMQKLPYYDIVDDALNKGRAHMSSLGLKF